MSKKLWVRQLALYSGDQVSMALAEGWAEGAVRKPYSVVGEGLSSEGLNPQRPATFFTQFQSCETDGQVSTGWI